MKKLESTYTINDHLENIFIQIFYSIIDFNKGNIKNFCIQLDNLLLKIDKLGQEPFSNVNFNFTIGIGRKHSYSDQ
jgi:hypothetical protein